MNQILVTEKLYITPELKRKKSIYKIVFLLSIFLILILSSVYVYAEYDKSKNEYISKDLLNEMSVVGESDIEELSDEDNVWKIVINTIEDENIITENEDEVIDNKESEVQYGTYTASNGKVYETVGSINIPKINVNYPILSETTVDLLKIAPCKFFGPNPNQEGNLCIAGHNYKNNQFFSKADKLVTGDIIEITDISGKTIKYSVYDKYTVVPEDTSCTSQLTNGKKIVTLITCTNDNKKRIIIHAKEIE